jgi:hypothetical protein
VEGFGRVAYAKWLNRLTDEQLLDLRLCDLPLGISGTPLARRVARLEEELRERGLSLSPHVWLSEEWFTPDGVAGFAIPFYLAHPRLIKLERSQMLEVEGGTERECLRIMRHEAGHAVDNAFGLHRRKRYRELFGSFRSHYPDSYHPRPNSRDFVLHLPAWYAQAHPAEDFAETFAVWVVPRSRWRTQYEGWPALDKLEYVDGLMREVAGRRPPRSARVVVRGLSGLRHTLREHYRRKKQHYAFQWPPDYDRDLLRIFSAGKRGGEAPRAAAFLRRHRRELCREVAHGTGVHSYAINQMFLHMAKRCRELKLHLDPGLTPEQTKHKVLVLLTVQTINGIHTGYQRIAL